MSRWWKWDWDRMSAFGPRVTVRYHGITRWRRGWVTLYKFVALDGSVEWRLYLPFNVSLGMPGRALLLPSEEG